MKIEPELYDEIMMNVAEKKATGTGGVVRCIGKSHRGYKCVVEHGNGETSCGLVPRWWNIPARLGF